MNNPVLASNIASIIEQEFPGLKQLEVVRLIAKDIGVKKHMVHNLIAGNADEDTLIRFCNYFEIDKEKLLTKKKTNNNRSKKTKEAS